MIYTLTTTVSESKPGCITGVLIGPSGERTIIVKGSDSSLLNELLKIVQAATYAEMANHNAVFIAGYKAGVEDGKTLAYIATPPDGQSLRTVGEVADVRVEGEVG